MKQITADDTGTFVLTTQSGSEYVLNRHPSQGTALSRNGSLLSSNVMVINCSLGEKGKFGVFLNDNMPDVYSFLETTPIMNITEK